MAWLVPRAHGTRTIRMCSFDVRSWGPSQATPWKRITSELGRIIFDRYVSITITHVAIGSLQRV